MNIIRVEYRFLRLSTNLALVELHPSSNVPQPTTCLYPKPPYLSETRKTVISALEDIDDWLFDQHLAFTLAIAEAKRYPIIDYCNKSGRSRDVCLWNYLDPLEEVEWDEYCPLFDNEFNYVLR